MSKSRVIIASPSPIDQSRIDKSLASLSDFEVIAQTTDLSATYIQVEALMPDIVLVADSFTYSEEYVCMQSLFRAVEARVVCILLGPSSDDDASWHEKNRGAIFSRMEPAAIAESLRNAERSTYGHLKSQPMLAIVRKAMPKFCDGKMILIGASTGGIDALSTILRHFPEDCPPTAIVQHTGQNFSETLVRLLDRNCAADVVLAKTGLEMKPGRICLAGGIDGHLTLEGHYSTTCRVRKGPLTSGHIPSIDELFLSALPSASNIVAALLTGMGRDGAAGLLALRQAGAVTVGQDAASSVVYGMPRVAYELGAVQYQLPLPDIGAALLENCGTSKPVARRAAL